ncbi:O-antigen ligase family protein [Bradyrhizobium sp. WSM 1704]|uniref:O-antigen ligase family protein n=1 Tax=Bradyrhizobium semiaridum TaxID=2821404 RepID=UPI001CE3743B|nr:O-antigen ligase family protein [Bradyrhizobium semiaridum]MCA6122019.1 O-antigen ligase family protein [Bradyrhizobium semiaridum]
MTSMSSGSASWSAPVRRADLGDRYLLLLSVVLLGYALLGKGFAYLGLPPIFIGEISLFLGLLVLLRTGCLVATLTTLPALALVTAMLWVLLRTLPFIETYGFDALRDSVVLMYGGFAFIVIALLLDDGNRINSILRYYGTFVRIFIPTIPFIYAFHRYMGEQIPRWPGSDVPILQSSGEVTTHLAGAAVFALVGFSRMSPLAIVILSATAVMASAASRGGMLAFVVPVVFAALVLGKVRTLAAVLVAGLMIFGAAFSVETAVTEARVARSTEERSLSTRQFVDNVASLVTRSGEDTEGTKTWRLEWWTIIVNDTVFGSNFWTGRGFGLNLADADGFQHRKDPNSPPLRSPHSVHMTILARAGVPGLALWALFIAAWSAALAVASRAARRSGEQAWSGLFIFIGCYAASFVINASFDVAIEGPVQGIWFWCLIGFGIGSVMVYRYQHNC